MIILEGSGGALATKTRQVLRYYLGTLEWYHECLCTSRSLFSMICQWGSSAPYRRCRGCHWRAGPWHGLSSVIRRVMVALVIESARGSIVPHGNKPNNGTCWAKLGRLGRFPLRGRPVPGQATVIEALHIDKTNTLAFPVCRGCSLCRVRIKKSKPSAAEPTELLKYF